MVVGLPQLELEEGDEVALPMSTGSLLHKLLKSSWGRDSSTISPYSSVSAPYYFNNLSISYIIFYKERETEREEGVGVFVLLMHFVSSYMTKKSLSFHCKITPQFALCERKG